MKKTIKQGKNNGIAIQVQDQTVDVIPHPRFKGLWQFEFEGEKITYSATRNVDYQNQDLPVSVFYNGSGIVSGKYQVSMYIDGILVGTAETILK